MDWGSRKRDGTTCNGPCPVWPVCCHARRRCWPRSRLQIAFSHAIRGSLSQRKAPRETAPRPPAARPWPSPPSECIFLEVISIKGQLALALFATQERCRPLWRGALDAMIPLATSLCEAFFAPRMLPVLAASLIVELSPHLQFATVCALAPLANVPNNQLSRTVHHPVFQLFQACLSLVFF